MDAGPANIPDSRARGLNECNGVDVGCPVAFDSIASEARLRSAPGAPECENDDRTEFLVDPVVEVVLDVTEKDSAESRNRRVRDERPSQWLKRQKPKRRFEFLREAIACFGTMLVPPTSRLSNLLRGFFSDVKWQSRGQRIALISRRSSHPSMSRPSSAC